MNEELKLNLEVDRGARAEQLMGDELLKEAFEVLEKAYIQTWRETDARDQDAREKLFLAVNIIGKVKDHLGRVIANGKLANHKIKQMVAERERRGNVVNINF